MKRDPEAIVLQLLKSGHTAFRLDHFDGDYDLYLQAIDFLKDMESEDRLDILEEHRESQSGRRRIDLVTVRMSPKEREELDEE